MADKRKHKEKYNNNNTIDIMHNEKQFELSVQCSMYAVVGWFVYSVDYHRYAVKQTSQSFNEWKRRTTQMNQKDKRHTHTQIRRWTNERTNEKNKCLSTNTPYEQNYFAGIHFIPHLLANSLLTNRIQMTKKRNAQHISACMDKVNLKYGLQSSNFHHFSTFTKQLYFVYNTHWGFFYLRTHIFLFLHESITIIWYLRW